MKTKLLSCVAFLTLMLSSCVIATGNNGVSIHNGKESDATVKKEIKVASFDEIKASQGITVIVSQGKFSGSVSVATTPSAEKYLQVQVNDGRLTARYDVPNTKGIKINGPTIIKVTVPELEEADLSSGASLSINGTFNSNNKMEFDLSSGSCLSIEDLICSNLSIETSSGASATVKQAKGNIEADASSGSSISIESAQGGDFDFEASSGADIKAKSVASTSIKASASSGSSIKVSGKTDRLYEKSSSGGSVKTSGLTHP